MGHSNQLKLKKITIQWKPGQPLTDEDRDLLRPLLDVARERGHTPRVQDVSNSFEIKARFRTWKNALMAAGLPLYSAAEQEVLRQIAVDLGQTDTDDAEVGQCSLNEISDDEIIRLAYEQGFYAAAIIDMEDVVTDRIIRSYCEHNQCGRYGTNYACPPACGTPEEMERKLRSYKRALVLQTKWPTDDYKNRKMSEKIMREHNLSMLRMLQKLNATGYNGLITGIGSCTLCEKCALLSNEPCRFPKYCISCTSAYCILVEKLAKKCGMEYSFDDGSISLFSLYAF